MGPNMTLGSDDPWRLWTRKGRPQNESVVLQRRCWACPGCRIGVSEVDGELEQAIDTTADLVGCPECGAVAELHDQRPTWVRDLPSGGRPVMLVWVKRVWCCRYTACSKRTWTKNQQIRVQPVGQPCGSKGSPKCASLRYVPDNSNMTKSLRPRLSTI